LLTIRAGEESDVTEPGERAGASAEPVRVVVVDDHPVFRDGLTGALAATRDLEVVAACPDGETGVGAAIEWQPDVVVMDLHLPGLSGIEATRRIVAASPHVAVLVLTMVEEQDTVFAAIRAGARGYLLKGASPEDIVRGVRSVARGEAVFGPGIAERVLTYFADARARPQPAAFPELTDRENEVLRLIAAGARNADIAARLVISPKTVRNHISNIFAKLQVADRSDAIALAREAGLGPDRG
jgi:DNA-binding NarL/FixJ family response regulator